MVIFNRILMFTMLLIGATPSFTNDLFLPVFHTPATLLNSIFGSITSLEQSQIADSLIQSSSIYSLIAIVVSASLVAMIVFVVYKSYKKAKRSRTKGSNALNNLIDVDGTNQQAGAVYFTPGFFSHESVPAIVVAEADEDLKLRLVNTLKLNYRVAVSRNGLHAFEKATSLVPDLVIVGPHLDELSTSSLVYELKNNPVTSHIPVILIGNIPGADLENITADHLSISFDARDLLLRVKSLFTNEKKKGNSFRFFSGTSLENTHLSTLDEAFLILIMDCLEDNYHNPMFGIEQISECVEMNKLQMHRKIKALTGKFPVDLIRHFKIEKAKIIMREKNLEIKTVAEKSGFSSLSQFSKAFKEYTGLTPSEFIHKKESVNR